MDEIKNSKINSSNNNERNNSSGYQTTDTTTVHDLDMENSVSPPGVVPTISHHVSLMNGQIGKTNNITSKNNIVKPSGKQQVLQQPNGLIGNGKTTFRNMLEESEKYGDDSYM